MTRSKIKGRPNSRERGKTASSMTVVMDGQYDSLHRKQSTTESSSMTINFRKENKLDTIKLIIPIRRNIL